MRAWTVCDDPPTQGLLPKKPPYPSGCVAAVLSPQGGTICAGSVLSSRGGTICAAGAPITKTVGTKPREITQRGDHLCLSSTLPWRAYPPPAAEAEASQARTMICQLNITASRGMGRSASILI